MSRSDSHSSSDLNGQRVNAAVGVAVKRKARESGSVDNLAALEFSIGKRIQGAYGAELRAMAEADPTLSVAELAERVIFPAEYPWENAPEPAVYSGERDRARQAQPNAHSPADDPQLPDWRERLADVRAGLSEPVRRPKVEVEVERLDHVTDWRACIEAGRQEFQIRRKDRLGRSA